MFSRFGFSTIEFKKLWIL